MGGDTGGRLNIIDYVTIASAGNAIDFGDLLANNHYAAACSSHLRGVNCGGSDSSKTNVIQYVTIASTGNAQDFGDLTATKSFGAACSDGHGGIA